MADGSQATSLVVSLTKGRTKIATQAGVAELRTGGAVKKIAAGESVVAGVPNPQTDDDDDDLSGGALAVLLLGCWRRCGRGSLRCFSRQRH